MRHLTEEGLAINKRLLASINIGIIIPATTFSS
jgi:hypothetical protein